MSKRLSADQIAAMTAAAKHRVLPAKSPNEINVISVIELAVADVVAYDKNPRHHDNPKYDEIKESIRVRGVETALYVTKRPGSDQWMLARGGKTRLKVIQELAQEDPLKWSKFTFQEVPWVSESEILAAHLVENTGREAMCFWDLAEGISELKEQIARETGKPVSARALPELLAARGVTVERATILAAEFALEYLGALGAWKPELCIEHIKDVIRPKITALEPIWKLQSHHTSEGFTALVHEAVARCVAEHAQYSPQAVVEKVIGAVAAGLAVSSQAIWQALSAAHRVDTLEELQAIDQEQQSGTQDSGHEQSPDPSSGQSEDSETGTAKEPQSTQAAPVSFFGIKEPAVFGT